MSSLSSSPGRESQSESRAQSSTVGVVLLTAVVVISVGAGGVLYLGSSGISGTASPLVDADLELTPSDLVVTHAGGDPLSIADLSVVVRDDGSSDRYAVEQAAVDGNGDDRFEPAEVWRTSHGLAERTDVVVLLVDRSANAVLVREHATVPRGSTNRAPFASLEVAPGAPESAASAVFDASASVDDERIVEYRWDWDADGTVDETTTDPRVVHAFPGRDDYTVTLTVVDAEGATDSVTRTVTVGTIELDDVTLADADGDGLVAPGDEVTVTADVAESGPGVDTVTADAGAFDAGTATLSDGNDGGTYEGSFVVGESPTEGDQSVAVTAVDDAGNADSASTGPLTVDATAPSIEMFNVTDQSHLGGSFFGFYVESYRIQWEATDSRTGIDETSVSVSRGGDSQATYTANPGDREYSNVRGFFIYEGRDHTTTIVATDGAGNSACRTVTDTADGDDPPESAYDSC